MTRLLIFSLLLLCNASLAQTFGKSLAFQGSAVPKSSGGGGSGPSGSPKYAGVYAVAATSATYSSLGTNINVSGNNTLMIAGFVYYTNDTTSISSMKMDGNSTSMTLITNIIFYDSNGLLSLYGGYNPAAGSNHVRVTMSKSPAQGTLMIYLVTNAPQSSAFMTPVAKNTSSNVTGYTNTLTTVNGGLVIDLFGNSNPGGTYAVSENGQVQIAQANCGSDKSGLGMSYSNSVVSTVTMGWDSVVGDNPMTLISVCITNSP